MRRDDPWSATSGMPRIEDPLPILVGAILAGIPGCTAGSHTSGVSCPAPAPHRRWRDLRPCICRPSGSWPAAISSLRMFVSADAGPMHLASTTDTPTIGLFQVTDPALYGPMKAIDRSINVAHLTPEQAAAQISARF